MAKKNGQQLRSTENQSLIRSGAVKDWRSADALRKELKANGQTVKHFLTERSAEKLDSPFALAPGVEAMGSAQGGPNFHGDVGDHYEVTLILTVKSAGDVVTRQLVQAWLTDQIGHSALLDVEIKEVVPLI